MKHLAGLSLLMLSATAVAAPAYHPSGPSLTYGAVSNSQTLMSSVNNPAAGAAAMPDSERQLRFGVLSSIGVGAEVGEVDNFVDELDTLSEQLEGSYMADPAQTRQDMEDLLARLAQDGGFKFFATAHAPLMPLAIAHPAIGGALVLDANVSGYGNLAVFDAPVTYDAVGQMIETDSSLLVRGAVIGELGLGYSRALLSTDSGGLFGGVRLKYYRVGLTRSLVSLIDAAGDSGEVLDDKFNDNYTKNSGFGLDLGVLWVDEHYRLGATVANINEPSFDYRPLSAAGLHPDVQADVAALDDEFVMEAQLQLEGALYTASRNWVIGAAVDANAVMDPAGEEYQWATLSAGYATDSWWVPGFRVGYRANLAGSELSYATFGLTLFKSLNLDIAYGLESVEQDGDSYPRSVMVNLGLELSF